MQISLNSLSLTTLVKAMGTVVATGGIKSITIANSTPISPVSSVGASGSGWVAIVVLKGISSLVGTINANSLTISVSDPGYDTNGNTTTVSRTITGISWMAAQYPSNASKIISTDGTDLTIYITLDDWIYTATSVISASITSSFYTGSINSSSPSITNLSTMIYPKAVFGWINPQQDSATGTSYAVEAVAFHRHARNGQQVACIKYYVTDGTNTSADVLVSATSTTAKITNGNIPEVWAGSVDMSAQTQGTVCNVVAKVYPWIGDSSSVLDLSTDGTAWPTSLAQTKLRVLCDRTGAYGGGYAYVKVGAISGAVSAIPAVAQAAPFPDIPSAMAALKTWNNANKAHNDLGGGFVRLMDNGAGGAQTHTISTNTVNAPGSAWCNVEKDPSTAAVISVTWTVQSQVSEMMRWRNLTLVNGTIGYNLLGYNSARGMLCLDTIIFDNTNNKGLASWFDMVYVYNMQVTGGATGASLLGLANTATAGVPVMAGVTGTTATVVDTAILTIGCVFPAAGVNLSGWGDGNHGRIIYNNRVVAGYFVNSSANTLNIGFVNAQNVYELPGAGGGTCMNYFSDGDLTTVTNYIETHNTAVGERCSRMYNDVVATKTAPNGLVKVGTSRYNIWDNYNCKTDTFGSGLGSVGNWAYTYSVGNSGNVSLFGQVSRSSSNAPGPGNADYLANAWLPSSEYNLFRPALGFTQAQIAAMFTSYLVQPITTIGGGNYQPLSTSSYLKNRVPVGLSVLKKDIAGNTRRTDGTGAAGAYESA